MILRYDINSHILGRVLELNTLAQDLCKREKLMSVDVWDQFDKARNLYGNDGLHPSSVGKTDLFRV